MNWSTPLPAGASATRRPVRASTQAERLAAARAAQRVQYHQRHVATLVHDPSGDFRPGMALSLPEIACGLKTGAWRPGTTFQIGAQVLYARADGYVHNAAGDRVVLVRGVGR